MVTKALLVAVLGAAGALARWGLGGTIRANLTTRFPWGTFGVNVLGCFLFGFVWALAEERELIGPQTRAVLLLGFMGAFTTFSSYIFECYELLLEGLVWQAVGSAVGQIAFGLLFLALGVGIGRLV